MDIFCGNEPTGSVPKFQLRLHNAMASWKICKALCHSAAFSQALMHAAKLKTSAMAMDAMESSKAKEICH